MSQYIDGRGFFERPSIPQDVSFIANLAPPFDAAPVIPAVYQLANSYSCEPEVRDGVLNYLDQPIHVGIYQNVLNFFEAPFYVPIENQQFAKFKAQKGLIDGKDDDYVYEPRYDELKTDPQETPLFTVPLQLWDAQHFAATSAQAGSFKSDEESSEQYGLLDQPQIAWIFETLTTFDAAFQAAYDQLTQSFRSEDDRDTVVETIFQLVAEWKNVLNYWEGHLFPSIHDQAQSFRSADELLDNTLHEYQPLSPAIWQTVLNHWDAQHYPATADQTKSFRSDDENIDRHLILNEGQLPSPAIWLSVLQLWDAQHYPAVVQLSESFRAKDEYEPEVPDTPFQPVAEWKTVNNYWEGNLFPSIHDQSQSYNSFEPVEDQFYHVQEPPQTGWIFTSIPAPFDAAFQPAFDFQSQSFRAEDEQGFPDGEIQPGWIFANLPAQVNAEFQPAYNQATQSYRVPKHATEFDEAEDFQMYELLDQPSQAWMFESLPEAFDAVFWPAINQLESYQTSEGEDSKTHEFLDQPQPGWLFTSIPPAPVVSEHELWGMIQTTPTVLDMTASLNVNITTELGALGPTIVCTHIIIEEL